MFVAIMMVCMIRVLRTLVITVHISYFTRLFAIVRNGHALAFISVDAHSSDAYQLSTFAFTCLLVHCEERVRAVRNCLFTNLLITSAAHIGAAHVTAAHTFYDT